MSNVYLKHGNALTIILLDDSLAIPGTLTKWDGSTGNIIFLNCLAEEGSENTAKTEQKIFRTNDQAIYATDISTVTGETKAKLYLQDKPTVTFLWNAVRTQIAAGKKTLEIYNMGYKEGKWQESVKLGDVVPVRSAIAGNASPIDYMFTSTPQQASFTLSSQNVTDIKAVTGYPSNHIHMAGPAVIAANEVEIVVYT